MRGELSGPILGTYNLERRSVAEQIIAQDKITTLLGEGKIPLELQNNSEKDPHKLLYRIFIKNQDLINGLSVAYTEDGLTIVRPTPSVDLKVTVGGRALDILIQRPGVRLPLRLYSQIKNYGRFVVVVFCGDPRKTKGLIKIWKEYLDGPESVTNYEGAPLDFFTILVNDNKAGAAQEHLRTLLDGQVFYDTDGSGHRHYGVPDDKGAILILRPDGLLGTACALDEGQVVSTYFAKFLTIEKRGGSVSKSNGDLTSVPPKGEVELE